MTRMTPDEQLVMDPQLLQKRAETPTPADGLLAVGASRLPADILREASGRLG